jgi:hypothetical protein
VLDLRSAYVSIRQHTSEEGEEELVLDLRSAYVSIRQHTSEEGEEELVHDTLEETTRP